MSSQRLVCVACHREIDTAAKLCPYCGADPRTGEKLDTDALLQEEFKSRRLTPSQNVLEYAHQRQGAVWAFTIAVVLLALAGLHQLAAHRNETAVASSNAVPLAEVTDITSQGDSQSSSPMPELRYRYDGRPQAMRTFVVEPGAVTPSEILAQQAAAKTAAAGQHAAAPQPPRPQPHH